MWASYDFMYPSKDKALERTKKSDYTNPGKFTSVNGAKLVPHTFIHETGHMFGLNDLYSYTENTTYYAGSGNMQTCSILSHDPYSTMLLGWTKPLIPEISMDITIGDFQKDHDVILLTPEWNLDNSPFDEYFLIDLYVPRSGLNEFDASRGLVYGKTGGSILDNDTLGVRIWHADSRLTTDASDFKAITTNPTVSSGTKIYQIADNSRGSCFEGLEDYDKYCELQMVRNVEGYDLETSSYTRAADFFLAGDTFSMEDFSSQFVNGDKLDNGLSLGWEVKIKGIYETEDGYKADIQLMKK